MTDIIQRAKRLLEGATPGPWYPHGDEWDGDMVVNDAGRDMSWQGEQLRVIIQAGNPAPDSELIAAAPELAKTVADMHWEYAVEFKSDVSGEWFTNGFYGAGMHGKMWFGSREEAEQQITRSYPAELVEPRPYRIIRRLVSDEEIMG